MIHRWVVGDHGGLVQELLSENGQSRRCFIGT